MAIEPSRQIGDSLLADLRVSLSVWRTAPVLPLVSVAIWGALVPIANASWAPGFLFVLVVGLFAAGWYGTQRIWYMRLFTGEGFTRREAWWFTRRYAWRFVRLGLVAVALIMPIYLPVVFLLKGHRTLMMIASAPIWLALDFALTFVTPALAFSTQRVREAIRIGFGMLRREWPASAPYVFVPPLAIEILFIAFSARGRTWSIGLGPFVTLMSLAFKGATAAFYLRRHEVGLEGSAVALTRPDLVEAQTSLGEG